MALRLFNTMSSRVGEFRPLRDSEVRMYACGPTVYDYGHIGNFRTFVAVDLLRRYLRQSGYKVRSEEHTSELQSRFGISYALFCFKKKTREHTQALIVPQTIVSLAPAGDATP